MTLLMGNDINYNEWVTKYTYPVFGVFLLFLYFFVHFIDIFSDMTQKEFVQRLNHKAAIIFHISF